ncbi:efflux RND transporter permease subunit [Saccharicrinis sp. FJH2]|uniref:efflux RND transporter permease subunit n=1 Tax=Saccharicrinis sp. FJH65 TaxID=3344659 RepID=UPI0035F426B7
MNKKHNISSFSTITMFVLVLIVGLALIPLLHLNLEPTGALPSVTISYRMPGTTGEIIDAEVTTPMEGMLSTVSGVKNMTSRTGNGYGSIYLQMNKKSDMDAVRFEISMLIRQIYPTLPAECSLPTVSINKPDQENKVETLIAWHVSGPGSKNDIASVLNKEIVPELAAISGIHQVNCYGGEQEQLELIYDPENLNRYGFTTADIQTAIRNHYKLRQHVGFATSEEEKKIPVILSSQSHTDFSLKGIKLKNDNFEVPLKDLVQLNHSTKDPGTYFRINGMDAVYLSVTAQKGINTLELGKRVKEKLAGLQNGLPDYSFSTYYDATVYLKEELNNIFIRIALSVFLLLLFILIVSRSWRYLFICFTGIISSLIIAFIFYVLLGVEIHLYSLAGITLSLGIIIDNIIIMTDHIRYRGNLKVFLAILASTLTTIGSLLVIFFLDEHQLLRLKDFAWVIIINLAVSLVVALFLIPALMEKIPLKKNHSVTTIKRKRRIIRINRLYERLIIYSYKKRALFIILAILAFGIPVQKLPTILNGNDFWTTAYNKTLGSNLFNAHIKPYAEVILGGVYRPFSQQTKNSGSGTTLRTMLRVRGSMPYGATLKQMNAVFKRVENYLLQYDEIDRFESRINSPQNGSINIWFKKEHELSNFPFMLKDAVQTYCIDIGGIDWSISGVGRGFDNSLNEGYRNSRLVLYGYNLEMLKRFAYKLQDSLNTIQRVEKIYVNGRATTSDKIMYEQKLDFDENELLGSGINKSSILNKLQDASTEQISVTQFLMPSGEPYDILLKKSGFTYNDRWRLNNIPISVTDEKSIKLNQLSHTSKQRTSDLINKENMEYKLVVEFDFIGSYGQKQYLVGGLAKRFNQDLPVGFRIENQRYFGSYWGTEKETGKRFYLIILIMAIIYVICAVLLESLLQPIAVVLMIPLTFIGVFLVFWLFKLPFSDGGYASLLLLSGLTVNSSLYILNDFNNLKKDKPQLADIPGYYNRPPMNYQQYKSKKWFIRLLIGGKQKGVKRGTVRFYIMAFNHKIIPIILTIFSTVLGFVPFLLGGKQDPFWFSLAAGTMGGLVFSIFALYIYLPLFIKMNRKKFTTN